MFFVFHSIPDRYKTQEMCNLVVSLSHFQWYILRINIKLKTCVMKLLMICLAGLKFIPD